MKMISRFTVFYVGMNMTVHEENTHITRHNIKATYNAQVVIYLRAHSYIRPHTDFLFHGLEQMARLG